jgi:hypothetical protein
MFGGLGAAGVLIISEALLYPLYWPDVQQRLLERGVAIELFSVDGNAVSSAANLLTGLALVFFYAAALPRFGAGARTAAVVAVGLWLGGYVVLLCALYLLELFPGRILLLWGALGLGELVVASMAGAWIYREDATPRAAA